MNLKSKLLLKEKLKKNQKPLALWAADCAEHVLPYFEKKYPKDKRPRKAIEACLEWADTGVFKMSKMLLSYPLYFNSEKEKAFWSMLKNSKHTRGFNERVLDMADIRNASLSAHAAARKVKDDNAACFAARAAGQAVATAHVPQHAFGASYYALKVIVASNSTNMEVKIAKELNWQYKHLPKNLRQAWQDWQSQCLPKNLKSLIKS